MPQYLFICDLFTAAVSTRQCVALYGAMIIETRIGKETEEWRRCLF
jgi:hypothetical protein